MAVKEDITERRRIEQSLRDSERRAKMAMDLALLVHWELDVASRMYTFDDQFYALYGTSADREGGTNMSVAEYTRRFLHPEDQQLVDEEIRASLANAASGDVRRLEHRILRADGQERFIAVRYQIQRNALERSWRSTARTKTSPSASAPSSNSPKPRLEPMPPTKSRAKPEAAAGSRAAQGTARGVAGT